MSYCDHSPSVVRLCVGSHLWTTSPLKPLGKIFSNFVEPFVKGGLKLFQNGHGS